MKIFPPFWKSPECEKDSNQNARHTDSEVLISTDGHTRDKEQVDTCENHEIRIKQLKRQHFFLTCFNMVFVTLTGIYVIATSSSRGNTNYGSMAMATFGQDGKLFQQYLMSSDSKMIVQEHIFCTTCDSIRGIGQQFVETLDANRCCLKDISSLLQLMRSLDIKRVNEYSTEISVLKSGIEDIREDTDILTKELFNSSKTNDTDVSKGGAPNEGIMWSMIRKNNRLLNMILNRRRSILYMVGTGLADRIYWSVEVESGELAYIYNSIHVNSGGQYMININIHFSKKICDGTENIGYVINQEYRQGEMLPIARARGGKCVNGNSINEDVRLEKVLQVGLGQRLKLHLQFDKNIQSLISKGYRSHHIIIYEL